MTNRFSHIGLRVSFLLALFFIYGELFTQTTSIKAFEEWNSDNGSQHDFQRTVVRTKSFGGSSFYYTAGATLNSSGNYDLMVTKRNPSGAILWSHTYNGAGNRDDYATDVQIDAVGNVYVAGTYYKDATDSMNAIVIKYNSAGVHKWTKTLNGAGSKNDGFAAIQVGGNAVVAVGSTWQGTTNKYDMLAVRYDSSGNQIWSQNWDYTGLFDAAVNLWITGSKIFIAGGAQSAITTYKYAVVTLKASDGSVQSSNVTGGTAFGIDQVTDLQMDNSGNIFITGGVVNTGTLYDFKTIKLDTALNVIWSVSYSSSGAYNDVASGLYIDSLGNIIVTGYVTTASQGKNYATVKYNSSGTQQWVATFNGSANGSDSAAAIVTLGTDIYVTGASYNGNNYDYRTLKYDASGNEKWSMGWNSVSSFSDRAFAIASDTLRRIVVSGQTQEGATSYSYMTVCYAELNTIVPPDTAASGSNSFHFTENRGQLRTLSFTSDTKAQFYCQSSNPQVFFQDDSKISFQKVKVDSLVSTTDTICQVDMVYTGANKVPARACDESNVLKSYYLSHITDGAVWIKSYKNVVYHNLYSNIDLEFGNHSGGVKHSYIVKPGGDVTDIDFTFTGSTSTTVSGTTLRVGTNLGYIDFPQAAAFEIDGSGNFVSLGWQPTYSVSSGHVTFTNIGSYDPTKTLVIVIRVGAGSSNAAANGNLEWCSYGGSASDDFFFDACRVALGEVAVGYTMNTGFSGSPGQSSGNYAGVLDGILMYYQNDVPAFHCYIGGTSSDMLNAVCLNGNITSNAFIYFAGSGGANGITPHGPYAASYTQALSGFGDAYVGCINVSFGAGAGAFPWFTYFGGTAGESINDIFWDSGNLYFTGSGTAASPIQNESGAYNSSTGSMLLGKFNFADSLVWSTRFGSGIGNSVYRRNNRLVVSGYTNTSNLPIYFPFSQYPYVDSVRNSTDAFLAQFGGIDEPLWSTYYGGTSSEVAEGVAIDRNDNVYICGRTVSTDFPYLWQGTTNGFIDSTYNNGDAFMAKFNSSGQRIWSSYFGGSLSETFYEVTIDSLNNVYFSGVTSSTNISTAHGGTTVYNQGTIGDNLANAGYGDGVIMMLNPALDLKWCTYFGGNNPDGIYGASISEEYPQSLILAGAAQSTSNFPWYGTNAVNTNADPWGSFYDGFEARLNLINIIVLSTPEEMESTVNNVLLYPNPSTGQITLQLHGTESTSNLVIYNTVGQVVYQQSQPVADANGRIILDLTSLESGAYFLNLQYGDSVQSEKFTIVR